MGLHFAIHPGNMRIGIRLRALFCVAALSLALAPGHGRAADANAALQQALGSTEPLYKASPGALIAAVKLCASRDPRHAGTYVALVLYSGRNGADAMAPGLVTAAIQGLGEHP